MKHRRILALLAAVLMALTLFAGCGIKPETSRVPQSSTPEQSSSAVEQEKKEYAAGVRTEKEYISEWMGLKYTLSDSMVMATDEEILQNMKEGAELLYTDAGEIDYENINFVYEMSAEDTITGGNFNIVVEKLALSGISEVQYLEVVKQSLAEFDNVVVTLGEEGTCMVAGLEFRRIDYVIEMEDMTLMQTMLCRKVDDRMVCVTLTYFEEADLEVMLSGFSAL